MDIQILKQAINQVQAKQELTVCVTGDENILMVALKEPKIVDCSIETIKEVLRLVMLKIGIREKNLPSKEEKLVLLEHIINNYGQHTCSEIKLAFDLAITDKLNIDFNDVKAYQDFNTLYVSHIMNAYREWSKPLYHVIGKDLDKPIQKIYTDEQIENERRQEIEYAFQAMKQGKFPLIHQYWIDTLTNDNLLQEGENLDEFFVRRIGNSENIYKKG